MGTTIETILSKHKSTMDPGTFLFKFRNTAPMAVHKDWLFNTHVTIEEYYPELREVMTVGKRNFFLLTNNMALGVGDLNLMGFYSGIDYREDNTPPSELGLPTKTNFQRSLKLLKYKERSNKWPTGFDHSGLTELERDNINLIFPSYKNQINFDASSKIKTLEDIPTTPFKDIKKIVGNDNIIYILTFKGHLYGNGTDHALLSLGSDSAELPTHFIRISEYDDIEDVWCGDDFAIIKRKGGIYMGIGSNEYGQLGSGELVKVETQTTIHQREFIPHETYAYYGDFATEAELINAVAVNSAIIDGHPSKLLNFDWPLNYTVTEEVADTQTKVYEFVEIENLKDAILVDCGKQHLLATFNTEATGTELAKKGVLKIAGRNNYGQLGLGLHIDEIQMELITIAGIENVIAISAKDSYNSMVLTRNANGTKTLRVAGNNQFGQLGISTSETYIDQFTAYTNPNITNIDRIFTGPDNTFFITDGRSEQDGPQQTAEPPNYRLFGSGNNLYRFVNQGGGASQYNNFTHIQVIRPRHISIGPNFMTVRTVTGYRAVGINEYGQLFSQSGGGPLEYNNQGQIIWLPNHNTSLSQIIFDWPIIFPGKEPTEYEPAYAEGYIYTKHRFSYEHEVINKWGGYRNTITSIFYKNDNGNWIDWLSLNATYPTGDKYNWANIAEANFLVPKELLPYVDYTDAEGRVYYINKFDNQVQLFNYHTIINNNVEPTYELSFVDIEDPTLEAGIHRKNDLRIEFLGDKYNASNFLVWLNGAFVDMKPDLDDPKVGYILNATGIIPAVEKCKADNILVRYKNNNTATIDEPDEISELRWDIKLKFFGWDNVTISRPSTNYNIISQNRVRFDGRFIDVPYEYVLPQAIHKDQILILLNGSILPEDAYEVDPVDSRIVRLKDYHLWVLSLLSESYNTEENYFDRVRNIIYNNILSFVYIGNTNPNYTSYLYRDRFCVKNAPYIGEVLFPQVHYDELVLVDGHYLPYEWVNEKAIRYPTKTYLANIESSDFIANADIYRMRTYTV